LRSRAQRVYTSAYSADKERRQATAQYLFVFRAARGDVGASPEEQGVAWSSWFDNHGSSVVDPGLPVFERSTVGEVGAGTVFGGYAVVDGDSPESALELAKTIPAIGYRGGVEIGVLTELPPEHAHSASRRSSPLSGGRV
jgi:hypothetical protein